MAAQDIAQFSSCDGTQHWLLVVSDTTVTLLPPKLDLQIYVGPTFAVMAAYALLLMISTSYIQIAVIPAIILAFNGALWAKFQVKKGRLQHRNNQTANNLGSDSRQPHQRLLPMLQLWYCLQLIQLLACAHATNGQQSGNFVLSHSLLFLSSTLGALAATMAALPIRASQGAAHARRALHRTFTVVLVIAVHTMAAEWMEEDMLLVCMPELIAALVWFTVNFDHAGCTVPGDKVASPRATVIVLAAATATLVAYMFAYQNERMVLANYWCRRILCSCTLSGLLSSFCVWMIFQWWPESSVSMLIQLPRITDSAMVPIRILEFSAVICFGISAMLLFTGFLLNQTIF